MWSKALLAGLVGLLAHVVVMVQAGGDAIGKPMVYPGYQDLTPRWSASINLPRDMVRLVAQPDYYNWWMVSLQGGVVYMPDAATKQSDIKTVVDISDRVVLTSGYTEFGLNNFVFSPYFATDRQFYLYYFDERTTTQTSKTGLNAGRLDPSSSPLESPSCRHTGAWAYTVMLSRFTWVEGDPVATKASEEVILYWGAPSERSHPGSGMVFVGDLLYLATGDQADHWNAQSLDTPKGKVLRINPFVPSGDKPYSIPSDNPFVGAKYGKAPAGSKWFTEIYSFGLRNPFRCVASDDQKVICGVVGQDNVESVIHVGSGTNHGWPDFEGSAACYKGGIYGTVRPVDTCTPITVTGSYCNTEPTTYELTPPILSYCHKRTVPLTGPYVQGVCSDLLTGSAPLPIGFYRGAGSSDGSIQKGDLLVAEPGEDPNAPFIIRFREAADGSWDPALVYGSKAKTNYGPYIVTTGVDWAGEILIVRYSKDNSNHVYRWNKLTYLDYPDAPVGTGGFPAPAPPAPMATPPPFKAPYTAPSDTCVADAYNYPEIQWTKEEDGSLSGVLKFDVMAFTNSYGTTTTRGYFTEDGIPMTPGPIMRMKAGQVYRLRLTNAMDEEWPNAEGTMNTYRKPCVTNLHVHGMHISPSSPADDVTLEIYPGDYYDYTFTVPVDHTGGTHLYHPHVHGSSAIQAGAGAVGMIIIEDNQFLEKNTVWPAMPEATLVMDFLDPTETAKFAASAGDGVYQTTATAPHYLVNGCDEASFHLDVTRGEWTKLRMLHLGTIAGSVVVTVHSDAANSHCDAMVLAKDGVYLTDAPRALSSPQFLFSISSRVDVAIRCKAAGSYHLTIAPVDALDTILFSGAVTVNNVAGRVDDADLAVWTPQRPYYLEDLQNSLTTDGEGAYTVAIRGMSINAYPFNGLDSPPMKTIAIDSINEFLIQFSNAHPVHMHVNHVQLVGTISNYATMPDWHKAGDWLDTVDSPEDQSVRFRADRYGGFAMLHCHILEHADSGMMAVLEIDGGEDATGGLSIYKYPTGVIPATCNGVVEFGETDQNENGIEDQCLAGEPGQPQACANQESALQCMGQYFSGAHCCATGMRCLYDSVGWSGCFAAGTVLGSQPDGDHPCNDVYCHGKGYCTGDRTTGATCVCAAPWLVTEDGLDCYDPNAPTDAPADTGGSGGGASGDGGGSMSTSAVIGISVACAAVGLIGAGLMVNKIRSKKGGGGGKHKAVPTVATADP